MAKVKYTGAGALVEVDIDGVPTWTSVGCTNSITPPPQSKVDVDVSCQQDLEADHEPGAEELSQMVFVEPMDYAFSKTIIDDFYDSGAKKEWRLTQVSGSNTQVQQFTGYVKSLVPNAYGRADGVTRTVTVTRTSPITWNPGP